MKILIETIKHLSRDEEYEIRVFEDGNIYCVPITSRFTETGSELPIPR